MIRQKPGFVEKPGFSSKMQLALSSFWISRRAYRPRDFFVAGTDLRFDSFELSGIHHDTFYDEVRPGDFCFDSFL